MKIIVVGCGSLGRRRTRYSLSCPGIKAADLAVVDLKAERRQVMAESFQVEAFDSLGTAIRRRGLPDVVFCSTPTPAHSNVCVEAAGVGVPRILCELGMTVDAAEAHRVCQTVEAKGCRLAVAHQGQFDDLMVQCRAWVQAASFGRLAAWRTICSNWLPQWHPWERPEDFYDPTQLDGVVYQRIAIGTWVTGVPLSELRGCNLMRNVLDADGREIRNTAPSFVHACGTDQNGATVVIDNDTIQRAYQWTWEFIGTRRTVRSSLFQDAAATLHLDSGRRETYTAGPKYAWEQAYERETHAFLRDDEVDGGWLDVHRAAEIMKLVDACKPR